jgi:hypothetical protein
VQAIAKWLVARPHNAVLALTVTLLLPAPQLTSGAIIVLLYLAQGARLAVTEALIAAAVLAVVSLILGGALGPVFVLLTSTWVPVALLGMMLASTRSLTLVLQMSVIVAVLTMLVFYGVVADPADFWQPFLTTMSETAKETGLQLDERMLNADVAAVSVVLGFWLLYVGGFLLGYAGYQKLPGVSGEFGRLRDLNLGRVIALTMALMSSLVLVIDVPWLQNIAIVMFVMFTLQGLALGHWFVGKKKLPGGALVAVYVMMILPLLQELVIVILAVVGYTDAWFGFRRRFEKA